MGGGQTTTTSSNKIDPELMALYNKNYATANDIANRPYQPYTGQRVAGFTPLQLQGQESLANVANSNVGADTLSLARNLYTDIANYKPADIGSPGALSARNVSVGNLTAPAIAAGMLKDTDLSPYMNPYTDKVVDTTLADLTRQYDIDKVKNDQAATASKAFGGSRHGVADAQGLEAYLRSAASTDANLRSSGYDRAVQAAISDIDRRLSVDKYNADNSYDASKTNIANQFAADTYNANSGMSADKYNLDAALDIAKTNAVNALGWGQLRGNSANALANISNAELSQAAQRAGLLSAVGAMQQQQQQALNDDAYERFMQEWSYPLLQQQMRNAALGMMPVQSTSTSTTSKSAGGLDILGAIFGGAQAAAPFIMSDARTKENVRTAGHDAKGRRWVDFNYKWDDPSVIHRGVIAQEILKSDPDAVRLDEATGLYSVDYSKLTGVEKIQ